MSAPSWKMMTRTVWPTSQNMSFNGTDHFPKKDTGLPGHDRSKVRNECECGDRLEQTVFNVSNVPLKRRILDSALMILHDWSILFLLKIMKLILKGCDPRRMEDVRFAEERMSNKLAPIIFKGSKYAKRDVIGDTAVLNISNTKPLKISIIYGTGRSPGSYHCRRL